MEASLMRLGPYGGGRPWDTNCEPIGVHRWKIPGGVVEWLMALVLKTSEVKASVGSNPTPSVFTGSLGIHRNPKTLAGQAI